MKAKANKATDHKIDIERNIYLFIPDGVTIFCGIN